MMYLKIMSQQDDGGYSVIEIADTVHVGLVPKEADARVYHSYVDDPDALTRQVWYEHAVTGATNVVQFVAGTAFLMNHDGRTIERL